jgi:cytochrome c6
MSSGGEKNNSMAGKGFSQLMKNERTPEFTTPWGSGRMSKSIRSQVVPAAIFLLAGVVSFAQSGEATYKAKCQMCHGATGMADSGAGKAMKVKPATDPDVKKLSEADMIKATEDGMGKMTAFKGKLSDAEIKGAVEYFRTFIK